MIAPDEIAVPDAPDIPGLVFRRFRGADDFPHMLAVITACAAADGLERADTVESMAALYAHLSNCEPERDIAIVEVDGRVVGYSRGFWWEEADGPVIFLGVEFLAPAWRYRGIGRAMLRRLEARQREIAAAMQPAERPKFFQRFTDSKETWLLALIEGEGYRPFRYTFNMVRPSLDDVPDFPLPAGLELRPARPEHYRRIWEADVEAFRDHWGFATPTEADYETWQANETIFRPELWQIAWDVAADEIAGQVRTFIDHAANEKYNRKRGFTEFISVRRPWRRRGLARALIAESLRVQRAQSMTESALGVDSESLTGATRVYEACGFQIESRDAIYRKPL